MEQYFTIRGKRIFVEVLGLETSPTLVYIHGGPGAGSYDFSFLQGEMLSKYYRLILVDQRGVLRSEHLAAEDTLSPNDIINDFEWIRQELNIKSWTILGHSFGGYLALLYYQRFPASIERIIFECPAFDLGLSACSLLRRAELEFMSQGNEAKATDCSNAALVDEEAKEKWNRISLLGELGEHRNNLYVHGKNKDFFREIAEGSGLSDELWEGAIHHHQKLTEEGSMFNSLLLVLSQLHCPALLMVGKYDPVTSAEQINAFQKNVEKGKIVTFERSGHFPRYEEKELYSAAIIEFMEDKSIKP